MTDTTTDYRARAAAALAAVPLAPNHLVTTTYERACAYCGAGALARACGAAVDTLEAIDDGMGMTGMIGYDVLHAVPRIVGSFGVDGARLEAAIGEFDTAWTEAESLGDPAPAAAARAFLDALYPDTPAGGPTP